jgi:hypothetical protein
MQVNGLSDLEVRCVLPFYLKMMGLNAVHYLQRGPVSRANFRDGYRLRSRLPQERRGSVHVPVITVLLAESSLSSAFSHAVRAPDPYSGRSAPLECRGARHGRQMDEAVDVLEAAAPWSPRGTVFRSNLSSAGGPAFLSSVMQAVRFFEGSAGAAEDLSSSVRWEELAARHQLLGWQRSPGYGYLNQTASRRVGERPHRSAGCSGLEADYPSRETCYQWADRQPPFSTGLVHALVWNGRMAP